MKPHRRKPSRPRSQAASPQSRETEGAGDENAADTFPPEVPYDPAMALAELDAGVTQPPVHEPPPAHPASPPQYEAAAPDPAATAPHVQPSSYTPGVYDEAPAGAYEAPPLEPAPAPLPPPASFAPPAPPPAAPATLATPTTRRGAPGARRPATPRTRTGYRPPRPSYGGGFSPMSVFMVIAALGLIALIAMILRPADLSSIQGYPHDTLDAADVPPRNLLDEAQRAMIDRSAELFVTEEDLNHYLNHRLKASQEGLVASFVRFRGLYVDFSPGFADVFIEREIFGMSITKSVRIRSESVRRQTQYRVVSWSIGRLNLGTRNVKPVMELFTRIRGICSEEWLTLQQMPEVRFEENRVVIDPRL